MEKSSIYITNINRVLKNIKSKVIANFIYMNLADIIIMTNKVAFSLDLQIIEKYVKNTNLIDSDNIDTPCLLQSKLYLKIIGISYFLENNNSLILADIIEIIKENHIFNNIIIALRPWIIKVSPKSDMAIIWLDIWNVQSGSKAKRLINRLSRLLMVDFIFYFLFSLYFIFIFIFLFLEQLRLGFSCHTVTSVTNWWCSHKTDHRTWENGVEGSGIKWHHTTWTTHADLMSYTWSFRVGCTVVSTDHE